jgi:uncharacterized protein DUF5679
MVEFEGSNARMGGHSMAVEAYCMKCKQTREVKDPKQVTMKNGRPATQGTCGTCGTKMFKIGSGAAAAKK